MTTTDHNKIADELKSIAIGIEIAAAISKANGFPRVGEDQRADADRLRYIADVLRDGPQDHDRFGFY